MVNICPQGHVQPVAEAPPCQRCGDDMIHRELIGAYEEQAVELQEARERLAQQEEGVPA